MSLSDRLSKLEKGARAVQFSHEERAHHWSMTVWRARLKLIGDADMAPEPGAEWLAEMNRDIAGEDVPRFREKLLAKFPDWREQFSVLSDVEVCALNYDWPTWARQEQLLPGSGDVCLEEFLAIVVEIQRRSVGAECSHETA